MTCLDAWPRSGRSFPQLSPVEVCFLFLLVLPWRLCVSRVALVALWEMDVFARLAVQVWSRARAATRGLFRWCRPPAHFLEPACDLHGRGAQRRLGWKRRAAKFRLVPALRRSWAAEYSSQLDHGGSRNGALDFHAGGRCVSSLRAHAQIIHALMNSG